MLPQVREIEQRFPHALSVVGVHSGKFIAERDSARIAHAAARLGVTHPVVNDRQFRAWRAWAVRAWPTLALVDARGYAAAVQAGELTADALAPAIARLVAEAEAAGLPAPAWAPRGAEATTAVATLADARLRYPGKVAVSPPDAAGVRRLAIADTGRHRVLVGRLDAGGARLTVERVIGRGVATSAVHGLARPGATRAQLAERADGAADAATFDGPQGLAFGAGAHAGTLFVADAGNHAVRAVALATGMVRTLAGTGARVRTREDVAQGALASPWDVVYAEVDARATLFVALAGTHQLGALDPTTGAARVHAGGRGEDLMDGPLPDALLAQPMGLATDGRTVWFADAESSAVRAADARTAAHRDGTARGVRTLVGTGLFDFGDADGVGDDVRLQHPQAVARHPDGRLLIVDSYNDALKWLDPATRRVTTWQRGLHEPGGAALADGRVWVADTNADRVVVMTEATGDAREVEIR